MEILEIIKAIWPLLLFEMLLMIWALVDLVRRKQVKHLGKVPWGIIVVLVNFFGPVAYLLLGRGEE